MGLQDTIGRWLGRVEIVLAGLDDRLRDGEEALARGDSMRARASAHAILSRIPGSPHGLALLADACAAAGLDAELELTLEELSKRAGSQAEVWVRLGYARRATASPTEVVRDAFVRALAVAEGGSPPRRAALLALADLDLSLVDGVRADLWLDRAADDKSIDVARRRAEVRLLAGDAKGALKWLEQAGDDPLDGRLALVRGRVLTMMRDERAFPSLLRALVMGEPGASEVLSSALAWTPSSEETRARIRTVIESTSESGSARWRAAFARAEGRREDAKKALTDAVAAGSAGAARALLDVGLEDGDDAAVTASLAALDAAQDDDEIRDARKLALHDDAVHDLDALGSIRAPRVNAFADKKRAAIFDAWLPPRAPAAWPSILARVDAHARKLHDLDATARIAELSAERSRPLRIAVVGEFNAGKSTFINALIGQDVAPTGVLPTTATLHHLRYAPDPIVRILLERGDDPHAPVERIVPTSELRATLKTIDTALVRRVEILLPIASLTRAEILDTPGFNAPDERHTAAARNAFDEADVAIWLLDANQPLKQTERAVLESARQSGLPVQMLINKADRLKVEDLPKVLAMVNESIGEIGLESYRPPVAFSARLALAGKLGDASAMDRSGWAAVSELLDQELIGRSDDLKERALRRRLAAIVRDLKNTATTAASEIKQELDRSEERRKAAAAAAAKLDAELDGHAKSVADALGPHVADWRRDVEVVAVGRDAADATSDPVVSRYAIDRALSHLCEPAARALAALSGDAQVTTAQWMPLMRVAVRAAAGAPPGSAWLGMLSRALVATAIDELGARAIAKPAPSYEAGLLSELASMEGVLAESALQKASA